MSRLIPAGMACPGQRHQPAFQHAAHRRTDPLDERADRPPRGVQQRRDGGLVGPHCEPADRALERRREPVVVPRPVYLRDDNAVLRTRLARGLHLDECFLKPEVVGAPTAQPDAIVVTQAARKAPPAEATEPTS
jgi:hypothetical protein